MSACTGRCFDCPHEFCGPEAPSRRPTKAAERSWRLEALFELEELGDLYGIDPAAVKL
ncbi:hypothetical protein ACIQVN_22715 [Streptomyces cyaneofuscatus]|uniref:hypothetical protein n=1 Tax=Streptomyces cyaneofuscatus TaxID=66883 RepID=UPI00382A3ED9